MRFRLTVPNLSMGSTAARVTTWAVAPGEAFGFGDTICEIQTREWRTIHRTKQAFRLARLAARRKADGEGDAPEYATMVCKTCRGDSTLSASGCPDCITYRVIASEPGVLVSHDARPGVDVPIGGVIGMVETPHETPEGVTAEPALRVVADLVDRSVSPS